MTKVFFVRHAQPLYEHNDDRTRPLTDERLREREKGADGNNHGMV